jgi:hypothetical protein
MNTLLFVVKYTAAVLSGAYGVYATLTDFHENENGKKVLSRKGRMGLLLLLISTLLSLSSDGLKDYRENRETKREEAKREELAAEERKTGSQVAASLTTSLATARLLDSALSSLRATSEAVQHNSQVTAMTLHEAQRGVTPFTSAHVNLLAIVYIRNDDKLVHDYLTRLKSFDSDDKEFYHPKSDRFPSLDNERRLRELATLSSMSVIIEGTSRSVPARHGRGMLEVRSPTACADARIYVSEKRDSLGVGCYLKDPQIEDYGGFRSLLDFVGATVRFGITDGNSNDGELFRVEKAEVELSASGGIIHSTLLHRDLCGRQNYCFSATITPGDVSIIGP